MLLIRPVVYVGHQSRYMYEDICFRWETFKSYLLSLNIFDWHNVLCIKLCTSSA